ncbi:hypothetical protein GCM10020255_041530 [Rhodococcus baikonurensis]
MPTPGSAVQVTDFATSEVGSFSTTAVQPGIGSVRADLRSGSATVSLVVEAVSDSVGTRNVRTEYPPCVAPGATTLTCAEAIPAASSTALPVATVVTTAREIRVFFMSGSVLLVW